MENNKLLELLNHQAENLNALLNTILKKQKAIVSNDVLEIENSTSEEEKLLSAINNTEKVRIDFLNNFYSENSMESPSAKIDDYLLTNADDLNEQQQNDILKLRNIIKKTTNEIIKVNKQNKYLITHSRNLLNEIVTAIFSERNNSLFDRRV
ncbi:MAG: flagellar export chaperone FlgN [Bacteroidetes bacterium]|nr:flagellar export chaperone FlgN [Bacteroidota bacterium]